MKVLFANPPWWQGSDYKWGFVPVRRAGVRAGSRWPFTYQTFSFPGWRMPFEYLPFPFFMGYAASYLKEKTGAHVEFRDSIARRESYKEFWAAVEAGQYDYIFFESATPSWEHDAKLVQECARRCPATKIVVTGPVTALDGGEKILRTLPVAACIQGEYERGAVAVVEGFSGVYQLDLMSEDEMNKASPPLYDEVVARAYYDRNPRGMSMPQLQLWSSRGCPFKCIFCVWPATMTGCDPDGKGKRVVRYYHTEHLRRFITERMRVHKYKSVYFDDDTFNLGTKHTLEMCALMREIGVPWGAMCRSDTIQDDVWDEMKKSGCYGVKIGFESGNQYVNDNIVNKHLDLRKAVETVHHLKRIGMSVHGTFTIGLPGETPDQMRETIAFAESLPLDSRQISGAAEIEGTPLHHLRKTGALDGYAGARPDAGYNRQTDGNRKWDDLIKGLREK